MNASNPTKCYVDIDVSKDKLDVYRPDTRQLSTIDNSPDATEEFCKQLNKTSLKSLLSWRQLEATNRCFAANFTAIRSKWRSLTRGVSATRAKGIGSDAKTDAIDAEVISKYATVVGPKPMAIKSDHTQQHDALVSRRSQLLALINQENNRLGANLGFNRQGQHREGHRLPQTGTQADRRSTRQDAQE